MTTIALILENQTRIEFTPLPPDDKFAGIFQSSCRRPPREEELATIARYTVNVCLSGPGGSLESALTMMQAGAAIVQAGGAGVFIDNSALAYGGNDWLEMTDDGGSEAISFALTSIIQGKQEIYTLGMQTMGFPDLLMRLSDVDEQGQEIINVIRYVCGGGEPIEVGHVLGDEQRPLFQVVDKTSDNFDPESPMHNPFGRLKIISVDGIAESN